MTRLGNRQIPNVHFHKKWQRRVKTWFNQPARHNRRRNHRIEKAKKMAPRPVKMLKPVVRCPTQRYNNKLRLGRGFTLEELKEAGLNLRFARTIGIAVDHRRSNHSIESLQLNVARLKEYRSRLILFPRKLNHPKAGDSTAEECKMASQLKGIIMAVKNDLTQEAPRAITQEERDFEAVKTLRTARMDQKLKGRREKAARDKAEEEEKKK